MYYTAGFILLLISSAHCLPSLWPPPEWAPSPWDPSSPSSCHKTPWRNHHDSQQAVRDLHTFELGTWMENLLVRKSGRILATMYTPLPQLYELDPCSGQKSLVASLHGVGNMLGIADGPTEEKVYVIGEDFPAETLKGERGSNSIYEIDLSGFDASHGQEQADVSLALRVPNATAINGLASVNAAEGLYVSTDFGGGSIYLLNLRKNESSVIISNEWTDHFAGVAGGADGIKVRDGYIYWTTFSASVFARVPINEQGIPIGPPEKLADVFSDDLCFGQRGEAYLTMPQQSGIGVWEPGQDSVKMLPGSVSGPTAVTLASDGRSLFVTTSGNDTQYPDHVTKPGKVVEMRL